MMAAHTIFDSESDEDDWVIQINRLVSETNLAILNEIPVCIYQVPKSLSCAKPEAFAPQLIAIGPYTHFRPELYPMERFKIFSAKRVLDYFKKHEHLTQLVHELHNTGPYIRACYHKYLDLKDDTLIYAMAIDGLFLLDFFHSYFEEKGSSSFLTGLEQQVQTCGVKFTKDAIIRDLIMLENQIPTYVLLRILIIESSKVMDSVEEELGSMLLSFCKKHSPLKISLTPTCSEAVIKHYHLLDLLYHLVVSDQQENSEPQTYESQGIYKILGNGPTTDNIPMSSSNSEAMVTFLKKVKGSLNWILRVLKRLKDIPIPQAFKRHIDAILSVSKVQLTPSETSPSEMEAPVVVTIRSVSELRSVGIRFRPSKGGIMAIEFDEKKGIFYLPKITLDVNSEVIMRNLVAHEALTKPDFLIFTRYTELMRAIIDTVEDVELLKDAEIIESSSSLSVAETEQLFNCMSKSIGPTKTEELDNTIKKVNKYYHFKQKANLYRLFTHYVYSSWKLFTLLATFVLLAMTALQTLCSVYDCPSHLKNN